MFLYVKEFGFFVFFSGPSYNSIISFSKAIIITEMMKSKNVYDNNNDEMELVDDDNSFGQTKQMTIAMMKLEPEFEKKQFNFDSVENKQNVLEENIIKERKFFTNKQNLLSFFKKQNKF